MYNIAKHYNVSADYLLGLSEIQSSDKKIETACEVTGLSEEAINVIIKFKGAGAGVAKHEGEFWCSCNNVLNLFITSNYAIPLLLKMSGMNVKSKRFVKMLVNKNSRDELSNERKDTRLQFYDNLEDFRQILKTIQHPLYKRAVAYYSDYYSVICGYEKDANIIKQAEIELQEIRELYEKEETAHAEHNPTKE